MIHQWNLVQVHFLYLSICTISHHLPTCKKKNNAFFIFVWVSMKYFCSVIHITHWFAELKNIDQLFTNFCLPLRLGKLKVLWKHRVFQYWCCDSQVHIYRPRSADFFFFFWHSARLGISQTSLGSAINCFLWDMIRAPLPSVESHLMEGVVTLRPIRSHERLTALSASPPTTSHWCVSIPRSAFLSH